MYRTPTKFSSTLDLARLPWFELRDNSRLVVVDDSISPIIDMHTHLAMAFFRRLSVDLDAATGATAYYMPVTLPLDLELYANKNIDAAAMFSMKLDLTALALTSQGQRTTHTAPNLVRDLHDLRIERAVVLPVDLPIGAQNSDAILAATRNHNELVPYGSVHPFDRHPRSRLAELKSAGALGIKLHPNAQFIAPDHPKTVRLCGMCGALGLPVLFHCGPVGIEPKAAERRCQVARYEKVIAEHPETTFVLGHSGALQSDEAIALGQRYENTYFELSSLGLAAVRDVLERIPPNRIVFGTDWPFYHQAVVLARVLIATDGAPPQLRRAVLHDNAAQLLRLSTRSG